MARAGRFDPAKVAGLEAAGWRAYYDRKFLKLFRLIITLSHEQFQIPFPQAILAAYHITRASIALDPAEP